MKKLKFFPIKKVIIIIIMFLIDYFAYICTALRTAVKFYLYVL